MKDSSGSLVRESSEKTRRKSSAGWYEADPDPFD